MLTTTHKHVVSMSSGAAAGATGRNTPVLGYWSIRGLAEPIRLLHAYVGAPLEEHRWGRLGSPHVDRDATEGKWLAFKRELEVTPLSPRPAHTTPCPTCVTPHPLRRTASACLTCPNMSTASCGSPSRRRSFATCVRSTSLRCCSRRAAAVARRRHARCTTNSSPSYSTITPPPAPSTMATCRRF